MPTHALKNGGVTTITSDQDMDNYKASEKGGWTCLLEEALPTVSSSTQIFANAPAGTRLIILTIRAQALTVRMDGNVATAGANGADYPVGTYYMSLNQGNALKVRAIQAASSATGWIQYLKPA